MGLPVVVIGNDLVEDDTNAGRNVAVIVKGYQPVLRNGHLDTVFV